MKKDTQRERILHYLYGEMTAEERAAFEADLAGDPALRSALAAEERFHRVCPVGEGPEVSEEALQESRLLLRMSLRRERERRPSWVSRVVAGLRDWTPQARYAFGAAALLLLGVALGRGIGPGSPPDGDRLEIIDLRVTAFDPATGRVQISFDAATRMAVEGELKDEAVQRVLAAALRGDAESGARLKAVGLMEGQTAGVGMREALVYALLHDDNPGVRLKAAEALRGLVGDGQVREALITALARDPNPGVRIEAIKAIQRLRDPATLRVLERKMAEDENPYIRAEAKRAVLRWRGERTSG